MSATIWFAPWKPGPAEHLESERDPGDAVVSVTEFTPHRPWTAIGASFAGIALRRGWHDVEGAVGLWLWAAPDFQCPRSGSVSVWRDERDLLAFVARHDHRRIMRAYRHRGAVRSETWQAQRFDRDATQQAARSLIAGWSARPAR